MLYTTFHFAARKQKVIIKILFFTENPDELLERNDVSMIVEPIRLFVSCFFIFRVEKKEKTRWYICFVPMNKLALRTCTDVVADEQLFQVLHNITSAGGRRQARRQTQKQVGAAWPCGMACEWYHRRHDVRCPRHRLCDGSCKASRDTRPLGRRQVPRLPLRPTVHDQRHVRSHLLPFFSHGTRGSSEETQGRDVGRGLGRPASYPVRS